MHRRTTVIVITGVVSLLATAVVSAAVNGRTAPAATHPPAYRIPVSVTAAQLVQRKGVPGHVVRRGWVGRDRARRLARDIDRLKAYPKGQVFSCPADRGSRHTAIFRNDAQSWTVATGTCGPLVLITPGHRAGRMFHTSARFASDVRRDFHTLRPFAEWVPRSVHRAQVVYRKQSLAVTKRRTVSGSRAAALVTAFDRLPVEPRHAVSCNVAGGPSETVTFRAAHRRWTAVQSTCTGVEVARDHKPLPTLVPDRRWDRAVHRALH